MTLHNPTDDQLNAAFAEKVAGWTLFLDGESEPWWKDGEKYVCPQYDTPQYTHDANAVLPWLEKWTKDHPKDQWYIAQDGGKWAIHVYQPKGFLDQYNAVESSFPRAAVLALLRAHGAEVTFDT